jgi:hypothetical protein
MTEPVLAATPPDGRPTDLSLAAAVAWRASDQA